MADAPDPAASPSAPPAGSPPAIELVAQAQPAAAASLAAVPVAEAEPKLPDTLLGAFDPAKLPAAKEPPAAEAKPAEGAKADASAEPPAKDAAKPEGAPEAKKDAVAPDKPGDKPVAPAEPAAIVPVDPVLYGELILPGEVGEGQAVMKVVADPAMMSEFTTTLGKFGVAKEAAQPLLDLHIKTLATFADAVHRENYNRYGAVINGWTQRSLSDPQIGGAGHETAMGAIARMRDRFVSRAAVGTPEHTAQAAEFMDMLNTTGVGSHPALLRFIHNIARMFDEPQIPMHVGQPTRTNGQRQPARIRDLYDNPRSDPAKRQ